MERMVKPSGKPLRRRKISEYGKRLQEKQELKKIYGLREGQLERYLEAAQRQQGRPGDNLLILLERRLDNTIYRLGFALTRPQARQYANHGLFTINGRRVYTPSQLLKPGDSIAPRKQEQFADIDLSLRGAPWLKIDKKNLTGIMDRLPTAPEIDTNDTIDMSLILQFYSR